jgi:hypothetical protein
MPPALFTLVIFEIGSHVYALVNLELKPPVYTSLAGMIGGNHHAQLFNWLSWSLTNFLPSSNHDPPNLCL